MTTFAAVARDYATAVASTTAAEGSRNNLACQLVALGFLGGLGKKEINSEAREAGSYTDDAWKVAKVALSRAWRAVGSDSGFGEKLAAQWAVGNFAISLRQAYEASAPAKASPDNFEKAVKLLLTLSAEELEAVMRRVQEIHAEVSAAEVAKGQRFEALGL